jgi:hypothetical protein
MPDFFDPSPEKQVVVFVGRSTTYKAERLIKGCEYCNPEGAEIPFDHILDQILGSDSTVAEYLLEEPARCPFCQEPITEKTLVDPV